MRYGVIIALVLAVLAAGCGEESDESPRGAKAVTASVPALRADLASMLDERAWLTALAARTALLDGEESATAAAARATLDGRAVALADRLTRQPAALLTLLERQDGLWAERARATATEDASARESVRLQLVQNRTGIARLLASRELTAKQLQRDLEPAYRSLSVAVDAVSRGEPGAPRLTAVAAARAAVPARTLAAAAKRRRPSLAGRPSSPAAELASLAAVGFTDSAYAQATVAALVTAGAKPGARLTSATQETSTATDALARLVTSVYGDDLGGRFGQAWDRQADAFLDYARAKTGGNTRLARQSLSSLDRVAREIAVLFDEADPDGSPKGLKRALGAYTKATTAAIRAQATTSPRFPDRLVEAADRARAVGGALATRIARQMPDKFPG